MPLTVDICRLNAQTLRDSTDKGETAWELLNPTLGVARHLPVLKINSRAAAERSEVARISFPVLNYHPHPLVYFPTITHFQGTWLETTHGSRRERAAAPARSGPRPRPAPPHAEGGRHAPPVCDARLCVFFKSISSPSGGTLIFTGKGKGWFRNNPSISTTITPPSVHASPAPARGATGTSRHEAG